MNFVIAFLLSLSAYAAAPNKADLIAKLQSSKADVLGLGADAKTTQTMTKVQTALKANPGLIKEMQAKMTPGKPLPYDKRFKVSEADYKAMLAGMNKIKLSKQGQTQLTVTRDPSGKLKLTADTGTILKKGILIDPKADTVEFVGVSKLEGSRAFSNKDGPLAPLDGFAWSRLSGTDPASASKMEFILAQTSNPEQCLLTIQAVAMEQGVAVLRDDTYLHYSCK